MPDPTHSSSRNLLTILSLMILIGTEVFAVAIAAGWAIAGLLELGDHFGYGLMGLFSLAGIYIMVTLWRRATTFEPITGGRR